MAKKKRTKGKEPNKNLGFIFKRIIEEKEQVEGVEKLAFEQIKKKSRKRCR